MEKIDNSELVRATQAGDREAFGQLVEHYQGMVYSICYRMTANSTDAEDLAHDAFIDAFLKLDQLQHPERFAGWLRALTLNTCRMWYRRRRVEWEEWTEESTPALAEAVEEENLYGRLVQGISKLKPDQRLMLVLHYWEGMSYEEAAEFLDVPAGTVMSRLHRSRQTLKKIVEDLEEEEINMAPDEEFSRAIEAEIEVLLRIFRENSASMQRLNQILEHTPERFAQLVGEMDETMVEPLALMLKRLGKPAVEVVLECYFEAEETQTRTHALVLLRELLSAERERAQDEEGENRHRPQAQHAYFILDRLLQADWERQAKVELIMELVDACHDERRKMYPDESAETLLIHALLCYADQAFPALMERLWSAANRQELIDRSWVLYALKRTGGRFCRELLEPLSGEDERLRELALAGMDVLQEWPDGEWIDRMPDLQRRLELRFRGKFAPLTMEQMETEPGLREETAARVAALLDRPEADIRRQAIALLSGLSVPAYLERIRTLAQHGEPSTRLAALRALSNVQDADSAELFMRAAREGEEPEQRIAVEALGRLRAAEALPLFTELIDTAPTSVQETAAIALGEIGGEEARTVLQRLISAPDRRVAKAAASALYGNRKKNIFRSSEESDEPPERIKKLNARRLQKVRGDARPFFYHNTTAAVCVLPEMKPYSERELTYHIAQVEYDYSHTRRHLVVKGIMRRKDSIYEPTELGEAMWRVEKFIEENYLADDA